MMDKMGSCGYFQYMLHLVFSTVCTKYFVKSQTCAQVGADRSQEHLAFGRVRKKV